MPADPRLTNAVASAACDAIVDAIDGGAAAGTIKIYTGTIPTDADTALGAQTLLATLTFSDPAFGAASNGVATASAITSDTSADATGTAAWARIASSTPLLAAPKAGSEKVRVARSVCAPSAVSASVGIVPV